MSQAWRDHSAGQLAAMPAVSAVLAAAPAREVCSSRRVSLLASPPESLCDLWRVLRSGELGGQLPSGLF